MSETRRVFHSAESAGGCSSTQVIPEYCTYDPQPITRKLLAELIVLSLFFDIYRYHPRDNLIQILFDRCNLRHRLNSHQI